MTFFARPNLDNTQFKQLTGSTLTLDGQTIITAPNGLSLTGDMGVIPIIATGETNNTVLTYCNGCISLKSVSGGTSSGAYSGASPTTCTVGGLNAGTVIAGYSISQIISKIVAPVISPNFTPNYNSLSITPNSTTYEIGSQIVITANGSYNQGTVSPVFCGGTAVRTGLPTTYTFTDIGGGICSINTSSLSTSVALASRTISMGSNRVYGNVTYLAGVAPTKGDGIFMTGVTCPAGTTTPSIQINITGLLPYYWGKSTTVPIIGTSVAAGNKVVGNSSGILPICFNSMPTDYLWLAVPSGTPVKTCWYVNGTNNGAISGIAGQTWAQSCNVTITSAQGCWANCVYNVYVTCLQTGTDPNVPMCIY